MIRPFPTDIVLEMHQTPSADWTARSTHVNNVPVELHGPAPLVVTTFGKGSTPLEAIDDLLDNISRGEATS